MDSLSAQLSKIGWNYKQNLYYLYFEAAETLRRVASPEISIIVISYRLHPDTARVLDLLRRQRSHSSELVFVDNGGKPGEFDGLRPFTDIYVRLNQNTGVCLARNVGAAFANAPVLLFHDDDGIPADNILAAHLSAFQTYDVISVRGVCLPKTDTPFNKLAEGTYYMGDKPFPVFSDLGGNTSYRADAFFGVGGWDDEIRYGGEEVDLSRRLLALDPDMRKQIYSPAPILYHDFASNAQQYREKTRKSAASRERLREKHRDYDSFIEYWGYFSRRDDLLIKRNQPTSCLASGPTFSILIPTYNRANYIRLALESALSQSYPPEEIVVVDDGSTDDTKSVVQSFHSDRISYIAKENSGVAATRNCCLREAKGDFIVWLDSDDVLLPDSLSRYAAYISENPETDVVYGDLMITDPFLRHQSLIKYEDWYQRNDDLIAKMLIENSIPNPSSCIRRSLFSSVGGYDESYRRAEDYEWWTRIIKNAKFKHIGGTVYLYRWHGANIDLNNLQRDLSFEAQIVKKLLASYRLPDLFPNLDWINQPYKIAQAMACFQIAQRLSNLNDIDTALNYARASFQVLPASQTKELVNKLSVRAVILAKGSPKTPEEGFLLVSVIVIINQDQPESIISCLESLSHQTLSLSRFEVILVSNGTNNPQMKGIIAQQFQKFHGGYIQEFNNSSRAAAMNKGLEYAAGQFILFIDSDTVAAPQLLQELVGAHSAHPHSVVALISEDVRPTDDLNMGIVSIPYQAYLEAGGLIESFRDYGIEEIEYLHRLIGAGFPVIHCPLAQGKRPGAFPTNNPLNQEQNIIVREFLRFLKMFPEYMDKSQLCGCVNIHDDPLLGFKSSSNLPKSPKISVVVLASSSFGLLNDCLVSLSRQTCFPDLFEVIVCELNPTDDKGISPRDFPVDLPIIHLQYNGRASAARNQALLACHGELVLFLRDNVIADPNLIERHLEAHRKQGAAKIAVLGFYQIEQEVVETPLMELIQNTNVLFPYTNSKPNYLYEFGCFWGCNTSISRRAFREVGLFDKEYNEAYEEDYEFGYRLAQKGYKIFYDPSCIVQRRQFIPMDDFIRRQVSIGSDYILTAIKHPNVSIEQILPLSQPYQSLKPNGILSSFLIEQLHKNEDTFNKALSAYNHIEQYGKVHPELLPVLSHDIERIVPIIRLWCNYLGGLGGVTRYIGYDFGVQAHPRITLLFPQISNSEGYEVVFQWCNDAAQIGVEVVLVTPVDNPLNWFSFDPGIKIVQSKLDYETLLLNLPDADALITTSNPLALAALKMPPGKGKKFSLLWDHKDINPEGLEGVQIADLVMEKVLVSQPFGLLRRALDDANKYHKITFEGKLSSDLYLSIPRDPKKPKIIFYPTNDIFSRARTGLLIHLLEKRGYSIQIANQKKTKEQSCFDIFIFSVPPLDLCSQEYIHALCRTNKTIIVVIEENYHLLPRDHPGYHIYGPGNPRALAELEQMIRMADFLVVPTPALANFYGKWAQKTIVIPDSWSQETSMRGNSIPQRGAINIGWIGPATHRQDVLQVKGAVERILDEFPETHLFIGGDDEVYRMFRSIPPGRISFSPYIEYSDYLNLLDKVDILLIPLKQNEFNQYKSDVRLLEAGSRHIPYIASSVPEYVEWGVGGLLVANPSEWYQQIRKLVKDSYLRSQLGEAGYQKAKSREISVQIQPWIDLLESGEDRQEERAGKAALLLKTLLESDDVAAALQQHEDELNGDVLSLIQEDAKIARSENNFELAEGLEALTDYVAEIIQRI